MSDSPPCQTQSSISMPSSWESFISSCVGGSHQKWEKFPMKGLLSLSSSSMAPKIKELLQILPMIHSKYSLNPVYFRELIILLCYLLMKGCANTSEKLINICMSVLQELLGWRLVVICGGIECEMLVSVWDYMNIWMGMLVPAIFASNAFTSKETNKKKEKNRDQQDNKLNGKDVPKSFVEIIRNVNMDKFNERDQLLLIFESLVVHKIRKHLTHQSLFEFDRIMRKVYTHQKFSLIYQGKGCVTHIQNKEKEKKEREREIGEGRISLKLVLPRVKEEDWKTFDVQAYLNEGREGLKIRKVTAGHNMQQWVIDSFESNLKPNPIKLSLISLLTRMKAIEVYKFLCLLEIYGYSPNIEFLDDYITDEKLLFFFTTFLSNGNLVKSAYELLYPESLTDSMGEMKYSYCDQVFVGALERCLNEGKKLRGQEDKEIFVKEFRAKLMMGGVGVIEENKNKGKQNKGGNTRLEEFWGEK